MSPVFHRTVGRQGRHALVQLSNACIQLLGHVSNLGVVTSLLIAHLLRNDRIDTLNEVSIAANDIKKDTSVSGVGISCKPELASARLGHRYNLNFISMAVSALNPTSQYR